MKSDGHVSMTAAVSNANKILTRVGVTSNPVNFRGIIVNVGLMPRYYPD